MTQLYDVESACDELSRQLYDEPLNKKKLLRIAGELERLRAAIEPVVEEYRKVGCSPERSYAVSDHVGRLERGVLWIRNRKRRATEDELCRHLDDALHGIAALLTLMASKRDEEQVRPT